MVLDKTYQRPFGPFLAYTDVSDPCFDGHLKQTCGLFRDLTHQRVLWCKFLRRFCRLHGVPPATYDLDRLSSLEIEAAVTRPYQFERRLSFDQGIRTYKSNILSLDTSFSDTAPGWDLSLDDVVETTALVRGGRFLVAVHDRHWLSCWDLWGTSPTTAARNSTEAKRVSKTKGVWKCPGRVLRILAQQSADDENTLVIAVYCQGDSDNV